MVLGFVFSYGSNDIVNVIGLFVVILDVLCMGVIEGNVVVFVVVMVMFGVVLCVGLWFIG